MSIPKPDPLRTKTLLPDGRVMYTYPRPGGGGVHKRYYTPVPDSKRKYKRHTPRELPLLPDDARVMPETKPGGQLAANRARGLKAAETRRARARSAQADHRR